jgi:hypothetical protein
MKLAHLDLEDVAEPVCFLNAIKLDPIFRLSNWNEMGLYEQAF